MAHEDTPLDGATNFDLTTYFEGRTRAFGIFEDRFGRVRRRFNVDMEGRWSGNEFLLEENFRYDDGERETRIWRLSRQVAGRFSATSADCVGALRGIATADTVAMTYRLRLRLDARQINVDVTDRIYRMGDGTAVGRAIMSKWGLKLGEISLFFLVER